MATSIIHKQDAGASASSSIRDELIEIEQLVSSYCSNFGGTQLNAEIFNVCLTKAGKFWVLMEKVDGSTASAALFFWACELVEKPAGVEIGVFPVSHGLPEDAEVINVFAALARRVKASAHQG